MTCSACGAQVNEDARFCASCGRPLRVVDDERRVVTVVFADLVGFTSLSEHLDPERVKNLVDRCFDRLADDVTSFGGQVDKIIGDALVALFGATVAHEDDPERAVRAALRMQATLHEEAAAQNVDLQMRVGVNTGEVLVGAMRAAGSVTAMGDVVNTASRLQTSADPGDVLVGPATHVATEGAIAYEAWGSLAAKGREEPVETWRALAPTVPPGHRARRQDVPLVGRASELDLLTNAVGTSITHNRAQLVLLLGDVGMGKSRLAEEVASIAVDRHDATVREGRCVPYGEANVWWPIAEALRVGLEVDVGDSLAVARASVVAQVAGVMDRRPTDPEVHRVVEGLLTLLGYDGPDDRDPVSARQEAGRALGIYAAAASQRRPQILQISDLHFADPAVFTLIDDVLAAIHHCPVVLVATARPALVDRWTPRPGRHNSLVVHLDPLTKEASAELVEQLVGAPVPAEVAAAMFERSGGNPFFLEELMALLDGDLTSEPGRLTALPHTLRGLVSARLDDLSPGTRAVLQDASVIGQRGPMGGLREMSRQLHRDSDVDGAVEELVAGEIMERDGEMWSFRSDLVREVAYQTITKADRASSHLGIAKFIEQRSAEVDPSPPWVVDQLAHHFGTAVSLAVEAGPSARTDAFPADLSDRARRWVDVAADRARRDQALPAAIRLYGQALDLLELSTSLVDGIDVSVPAPAGFDPADAPRSQEVVRLRLARASAAGEGWDVKLARSDADEARRLADQIGDRLGAARAMVVQGAVEQKEGDPDAAIEILSHAAAEFEDLGDRRGLGDALRQRGMVEILAGRLDGADQSLGAALVAFEEADDALGQAWALQNLAWTAFITGRATEADEHLQAAIELFSELVDSQGLAWSLGLLSWVRFQQKRVREAEALGEQVLEEARARHDPWSTAMMLLLVTSIRLWQGRTDQAVEGAREALRTFTEIGDQYGIGQAGAVLGRALVMAGDVEEGFALLVRSGELVISRSRHGHYDVQPARITRVAAAVQVGESDRSEDLLAEMAVAVDAGIGGNDALVLLALSALQDGDLAGATDRVEAMTSVGDDPNASAAAALVSAAAGTGDSAVLADQIASIPGSTYLDRALGQVAASLEAATGDAGSGEALHRLALARGAVSETEDRLAQAIVEMAAVAVERRLGGPNIAELEGGLEHRLAHLGIEAAGWKRLFALATRSVPAG